MALSPLKYREIVFQLLLSQDYLAIDEEAILTFMMKELKVSRKNVRDAVARMFMVWEKKTFLDEKIASCSDTYSLERIQRVERNILRLAIFELFYDKEMPERVTISEAMRLCRKFSTKESANFVNALLDRMYKESLSEQPHTV